MNILVLTNEYPNEEYPKPDWTWVVPYFCRSWVEQGHKVIAINNASSFPFVYYRLASVFGSIIAKHYGGSKEGLDQTAWTNVFTFTDFGVDVLNLPMKKRIPGGKYTSRQLYEQSKKIDSYLRTKGFEPDVITGHWVNPQLPLVVMMGKKYPSAFTGFVFHGDYGQDICEKFNVNRFVCEVGRIGFRNRKAMDDARKYLEFKRDAFICESGIPDEYVITSRKRKSFDNEFFSVVSAGRLVEYKNFPAVINACCKSFDAGAYRLSIIGEGPLKQKLSKHILSMDAQNNIVMPGRVSREKLFEILFNADVFVLISSHETFGLVYLEAMLQGCIVIASKNGGMDGIIHDGENGFLCEEGNEEELASILSRISQMTIMDRAILSENAINTACAHSDSKMAERYLKEITGIK